MRRIHRVRGTGSIDAFIQDLAELLDKYRGTSEVSDALVEKIEDSIRQAVENCRPYMIIQVEFLLPADADVEQLNEALSQLREECFNGPICEWRRTPEPPKSVSGPFAEDLFEQHDLEYRCLVCTHLHGTV